MKFLSLFNEYKFGLNYIYLPPALASGFSGTTYIMNLGILTLFNPFTLEETLELPPALAGG